MPSPYTLGAEEELQTVDGSTYDLVSHDFPGSALAHPEEAAEIDCEIHRCVLEVKTPICGDGVAIGRHLARLRRVAERWAQDQGQHVLAAGLHPFADWRAQETHAKPHYQHLVREYRDVALGNLTFGFHLHVGMPDPATRLPVLNLLRHDLPLLLALSVSSPFCEGRDTGLQSWRMKVFDKYPRTGIPEPWPDEAAYRAHVARLVTTGCLEPDAMPWEDLRLHLRYGTLEVRICDANPSLHVNTLLADLVQALVAHWDAQVQSGCAPWPWPRGLVEENKWRACRHGLSGTFVDWERDLEMDALEAFQRLLDRVAPAARALGSLERIERGLARAFLRRTSAEQQRCVAQAKGLAGLARHLHHETLAVGTWLDANGVAA